MSFKKSLRLLFVVMLAVFLQTTVVFAVCQPLIIQQDSTTCSGSAVGLSVNTTTPVSVSWSTGETTISISVSPVQTTTYYVTVDDGVEVCTDSIILTVAATYSSSNSATICQGQSYTLPNGQVVSTAGTYVTTLTASNGCDSVVTTVLTIKPTYAVNNPISRCQGQSYTLPNGQVVSTAGTYVTTLTASNGCDSVVTTVLTIKSTYAVNNPISRCQGQSYTLPNGQVVSTAGTYVTTLTASNGCDSVVTTVLTIKSTYAVNNPISRCQGQSYTLPNGQVVSTAGTYVTTLTASNGCDSVVTTVLTIKSTYAVNNPISRCQGQSYTLPNGQVVSTAGTYVTTLTASNGCDSVVTTVLTIKSTYAVNNPISRCQGQSYTLPNGQVVSTAGTYVTTLTASNGCDSVVTTVLTIKSTYAVNNPISRCQGQSYTLPNGQVVSTAGTYVTTLTASNGCDSVVTTVLTIKSTYAVNNPISRCQGQSYTLPNGQVVSTAGTYVTTLTASNGCDSVVTTVLTIKSTYAVNNPISRCQGQSYTLPNGQVVSTAGTYVTTLTASNGCDSVVTTTFTLRPVYSRSDSVSICNGDSYLLPNGVSVTTAGVYPVTLTSSLNCDSLITTTLSVRPVYDIVVLDTICQDTVYYLPDGQSVAVSGSYPVLLVSSVLCDSLVTTELTVNPVYNITRNITICQGSSYVLPNGNVVTAPGTYTVNLQTEAGCDSIIVTVLSVKPIYNINRLVSICQGDAYALPDGRVVSTAGVYNVNLFTINGCDSLIRYTISVRPVYDIVQTVPICSGDTLILPGGQSTDTAGVFSNTFATTFGCDSVVTTYVILNPVYTVSRNVSICQGSSYILPDGTPVSSPGIYTVVLNTVDGCDSTVIIDLFVGQVINNVVNESICAGDTFYLPTGTPITSPGTFVFNYVTVNNCDSTLTINLSVNPRYSFQLTDRICLGDIYLLPNGLPVNAPGVYPVNFVSSGNCDSLITVFLTVDTAYALQIDTSICSGVDYVLPDGSSVNAAGTYVSNFQTVQGCDSIIVTLLSITLPPLFTENRDLCVGQVLILPGGQLVDTAGVYQYTLAAVNGCDSLKIFSIVSMVGFIQNPITGPVVSNQWQTMTYLVPYFAGHNYDWEVLDGWLVNGDGTHEIQVQWNTPGVGTVILHEDDSQCFYSDTLQVSVNATGVVDLTGHDAVNIFPNPFADKLNITWSSHRLPTEVVIYDLSGREVMRNPCGTENDLVLDTALLAPGTYLLALLGEEITITRIIRH